MDDSDERSYRAFVQSISSPPADAVGEVFFTRAPKHAAIAVKALFEKAENLVEILTKNLRADIYGSGDVYLEALSFLNRSYENRGYKPGILILFEDDFDIENHPLIMNIRARDDKKYSEGLSIRRVSAAKESYSYHFMVSDSKNYRFTRQRPKLEAINQFNNPEFGTNLHRTFLKLWNQASDLKLSGQAPDKLAPHI